MVHHKYINKSNGIWQIHQQMQWYIMNTLTNRMVYYDTLTNRMVYHEYINKSNGILRIH